MVKQFKFISTTVSVLVLALAFGAGPIYAEHGTSSDSSDQESHQSGRSLVAVNTGTDNETEGTTDSSDVHKKGAEIATEMRKNHKSQTAEQRQKKCEAHKQGLTTKFNRMVTNSQRIQDHISKIMDKAVAYQQDNNLQVDNFDTLLAAAQSAKTTSADSITALKDVTPTLDCNNVSVASDVAAFKAAAQTTRSSLKAYKTAVHNLLKALENAKEASTTNTTNTEGSNQ